MLAFIVVYLVIGVVMVFCDLAQPIINRPMYLRSRESRISGMLSKVLLWPLLLGFWRHMFTWSKPKETARSELGQFPKEMTIQQDVLPAVLESALDEKSFFTDEENEARVRRYYDLGHRLKDEKVAKARASAIEKRMGQAEGKAVLDGFYSRQGYVTVEKAPKPERAWDYKQGELVQVSGPKADKPEVGDLGPGVPMWLNREKKVHAIMKTQYREDGKFHLPESMEQDIRDGKYPGYSDFSGIPYQTETSATPAQDETPPTMGIWIGAVHFSVKPEKKTDGTWGYPQKFLDLKAQEKAGTLPPEYGVRKTLQAKSSNDSSKSRFPPKQNTTAPTDKRLREYFHIGQKAKTENKARQAANLWKKRDAAVYQAILDGFYSKRGGVNPEQATKSEIVPPPTNPFLLKYYVQGRDMKSEQDAKAEADQLRRNNPEAADILVNGFYSKHGGVLTDTAAPGQDDQPPGCIKLGDMWLSPKWIRLPDGTWDLPPAAKAMLEKQNANLPLPDWQVSKAATDKQNVEVSHAKRVRVGRDAFSRIWETVPECDGYNEEFESSSEFVAFAKLVEARGVIAVPVSSAKGFNSAWWRGTIAITPEANEDNIQRSFFQGLYAREKREGRPGDASLLANMIPSSVARDIILGKNVISSIREQYSQYSDSDFQEEAASSIVEGTAKLPYSLAMEVAPVVARIRANTSILWNHT